MNGPNYHYRAERTIGVLVVEHEPLLHPLIRMGLEPHDFELQMAVTLSEGLHLLEQHKEFIKIALLGGSTLADHAEQTIAALRTAQPAIAIVVMTGDFYMHQPDALRNLGVVQVIRKPFQLMQLVQAVKQAAMTLPPQASDVPSVTERKS